MVFCILHFLYKESFRDPGMAKRCLTCMIELVFSYPETGDIFLRLLKPEPQMMELIIQLGFEPMVQNNLFGKSLHIFRIRRTPIQTDI